ncbi:hypothetical protein CVD28_02250 [Bacillus sp. M6-12]|uniref:hypothetical protein n=1 Tax=Bacillus sp. M6-12 TaxID=2054166 RepID=UPI000C780349|nr:hypothetical protein [Bacillus sp. M6-12]PLS19254.1 hypothetical protein CVD28_02250 [Bacillus sp. M6-12]
MKKGRPKGSFKGQGKTFDRALNFGLLEPHEVVEELKSKSYMDEDGDLTDKGKGFAEDRLKKMDNGELILIEKYFAELFQANPIEYK